jgi:hypothetical protein
MIKLDMKLKKILGHKIVDNEYQFLIKWKNYDDEHNSWIPINNVVKMSLFVLLYVQVLYMSLT